MDEEIKSFNFKDLPDRLNDLDEDQLKLIHEELSAFRTSFDNSNDINDIVNEIFTCRLEEKPNRFSRIIALDRAIKHVKTLPEISIEDDVPRVVRYFLEELFKGDETPGKIVVQSCSSQNHTDVLEVVIHNQDKLATYLVGSDDDFSNLLRIRLEDDNDFLGYFDPAFVWRNANCFKLLTSEFRKLAESCSNVELRGDLYRLVLDDYESLASEAISEDGIKRCFNGLDEPVEFHVDGSNDDYFYLQVDH